MTAAVREFPPGPTLADVLPSALSALGVRAGRARVGLEPTARVVVLVIDGLGWGALGRNAELAPFLTQLTGGPIAAGFPTTTAASLASIGTGRRSGGHGLTGYTAYVTDPGDAPTVVNWLRWRPVSGGGDLRDSLVPELVQPRPTQLEQATAAGVYVATVSGSAFAGSGLTRAVLRGGSYAGTVSAADVVAVAAEQAGAADRTLTYCYLHELDLVGHVRGPDTESWRVQLGLLDTVVAQLARRLPAGTTLMVTADHGMVDVPDAERVDYDAEPELAAGVVALAGEPRARYVHVEPGAADDVRAAWLARLGPEWMVLSRDEAIDAGWFGPEVTETARGRIGDLLAVPTGAGAVVQRRTEPGLSTLRGLHGALTDEELWVPLLIHRT
jgi:hypothetical protein